MALAAVLFEIPVKVPRLHEECRVFPVKLLDGILLPIQNLLGHEHGTGLLA